MFNKLNKRANVILSIVLIALALLVHYLGDDYLKKIDLEVLHFFAGFIFAIGFANLYRVFFKK